MSQKIHQNYTTPQRWWQNKRVPLYVVVGGTVACAITFLTTNRATHPMVEGHPEKRKDGLPHEHPDAAAEGRNHFESSGRKLTSRDMGMMEGQRTDGIAPNRKISEKIGGTILERGEQPMKKPSV